MGSCQVVDSSLSFVGPLCYDLRAPHLLPNPAWRLAVSWRCVDGLCVVLGGCGRLQSRVQDSQGRSGHPWQKKTAHKSGIQVQTESEKSLQIKVVRKLSQVIIRAERLPSKLHYDEATKRTCANTRP